MAVSILIVEDEQTLSGAYEMILKNEGYKVKIANNGQEALALTEDYEPDIILLDLRMPVMDGISFLKAYKPKQNHPNVYIIVFSNLDVETDIEKAYSLGAHKYMLKAWASPKELVKIVHDALRNSDITKDKENGSLP
jgi:DNA-binding response OmpR family regulator